MSDDAVKLDTRNLDGVLKALKENMSRVRVGILGGKNIRNNVNVGGGRSVNAGKSSPKGKFNVTTNAAVGALHEFGVPGKLPVRSFLRMPISENLGKELENSGAFKEDALRQVVKEKSLLPWLHRIAIVAEKIVSDAFETGGFGKWPKWKGSYTNNTGMVLVDTQQLRKSITSEVK